MSDIKVWVGESEMYPVFSLSKQTNPDLDSGKTVTEEEFADYVRVRDEYYAWQSKLGRLSGRYDDE